MGRIGMSLPDSMTIGKGQVCGMGYYWKLNGMT